MTGAVETGEASSSPTSAGTWNADYAARNDLLSHALTGYTTAHAGATQTTKTASTLTGRKTRGDFMEKAFQITSSVRAAAVTGHPVNLHGRRVGKVMSPVLNKVKSADAAKTGRPVEPAEWDGHSRIREEEDMEDLDRQGHRSNSSCNSSTKEAQEAQRKAICGTDGQQRRYRYRYLRRRRSQQSTGTLERR